MGIVERIWDMSPYPRKSEIYIVLADLAAVTMATATPEIKQHEVSQGPGRAHPVGYDAMLHSRPGRNTREERSVERD